MTPPEDIVYVTLSDNLDLNALVEGNYFGIAAPEGQPPPYVVFSRQRVDQTLDMDFDVVSEAVIVRVEYRALDYSTAEDMAAEIRSSLQPLAELHDESAPKSGHDIHGWQDWRFVASDA